MQKEKQINDIDKKINSAVVALNNKSDNVIKRLSRLEKEHLKKTKLFKRRLDAFSKKLSQDFATLEIKNIFLDSLEKRINYLESINKDNDSSYLE